MSICRFCNESGDGNWLGEHDCPRSAIPTAMTASEQDIADLALLRQKVGARARAGGVHLSRNCAARICRRLEALQNTRLS